MLTEAQVKALKATGERYRVCDDRGLYVDVKPGGSKSWLFRYLADGKRHNLSLGEYPLVTLREARQKRDELKFALAHGEKPHDKPEALPTFENVACEWHEKQVTPRTPRHARKVMSILSRLLFPHFGGLGIADVTAPVILDTLRLIEVHGHNDTAHTAREICGQVFRYAIATGRATSNPVDALRGALAPVVSRHRKAITDPKRIAELLRAMRAYSGGLVVKHALWFSIYSMLRPGEVRTLEWTHVNEDEIRIPPEKMKTRHEHIVPMSPQIQALLEAMRPLTGRGRYVFPATRDLTGSRPMSDGTIRAALYSLGFGEEQSAHGFRSMASTRLNEMGWPPDVIERQLAHVEGNSVRAAYNHAEYLPERRKMLAAWADWIDSLA